MKRANSILHLSIFGLLITILIAPVSWGETQSLDLSELDAICKADAMSAGYVPVGEIDSSECGTSEPGKKNAWLIDTVTNTNVSCLPPDYLNGYPSNISLMICNHLWLDSCPPKLDGTENAFLLTKISECKNESITSDLQECRQKLDPNNIKSWSKSKKLGCYNLKNRDGPDSYLIELNNFDIQPLCVYENPGIFNSTFGSGLQSHNITSIDSIYLIIRMFYSENCTRFDDIDSATLNGHSTMWDPYDKSPFNTAIIKRVDFDDLLHKEIFMCSESLKKMQKTPGTLSLRKNAMVLSTEAEEYEVGSHYFVKEIFHDDRCGVGTEKNAYLVFFGVNSAEIQSEASAAMPVWETMFGLTVLPLTGWLTESLGLDQDEKGLVVVGIEPGSIADREPIKEGDVIFKIGNGPLEMQEVDTISKFQENIKSLAIGGRNGAFVFVRNNGNPHLVYLSFFD